MSFLNAAAARVWKRVYLDDNQVEYQPDAMVHIVGLAGATLCGRGAFDGGVGGFVEGVGFAGTLCSICAAARAKGAPTLVLLLHSSEHVDLPLAAAETEGVL